MTRTARSGPRRRGSRGCCGLVLLGIVLVIALLLGGVWLLVDLGSSCDAACRAAPSSPYQGGGG